MPKSTLCGHFQVLLLDLKQCCFDKNTAGVGENGRAIGLPPRIRII